MSTGAFEDGKYEQGGTSTNIWPLRVQPETKGLTLNSVANDYPTGDVTAGLPTMKLSTGNREFGVVPRRVTIEFTADGTGAQEDFTEGKRLTLPVFQASVWDGYAKGQTGTYQGVACKFVSKQQGDLN